jgi:hypothetical protein
MFITMGERSRFVSRSAHLLGQEWDKILAGQNCLSQWLPLVLCSAAIDGFVTRSNREERVAVANGGSPACE